MPTAQPSAQPTSHPTLTPTTATPTYYKWNSSFEFSPKLLHRFTFEDVFPDGIIPKNPVVRDTVNNATATLYGGATLSSGKAVFAYAGSVVPYIQLPFATLDTALVATIELWAHFEENNDASSTLYTFGNSDRYESFIANFTGTSLDIHIAVVYNPPKGYAKVYFNGLLVQTNADHGTLLNGLGLHDSHDYIGRNIDNTSPGMNCEIEEFRVWVGELSAATVYSHYLIGVDPSHITIPSAATMSNVNVTFKATSMQPVNVSFLGGLSQQVPMFGPETSFNLVPLDSQCKYSVNLQLEPSSMLLVTLPAMNYSVTLMNTTYAPVFNDSACDPFHPTTPCVCEPSKTPYEFLLEANQLSQTLIIAPVDELQAKNVSFTYRSGMCFELIGGESFAMQEGRTDDTGVACYSSLVMNKGQNKSVTIWVFERYPDPTYFDPTYVSEGVISNIIADYFVPNVTISILDQVSGLNSPVNFAYNSTLVIIPPSHIPAPQGLKYMIEADDPNLVPPYAKQFQVTVTRSGPDFPSVLSKLWFIPIIGAIPNKVPFFIPMASDPTLIFLVIRDPPGGNSYTSIKAGTTIDFELSIDGMFAYEATVDQDSYTQAGDQEEIKLMAAPFGFGLDLPSLDISDFATSTSAFTGNISATRTSHMHYKYSLTFEYEFATSTDPNIAGHPSDVIIGGGVDIVYVNAYAGN